MLDKVKAVLGGRTGFGSTREVFAEVLDFSCLEKRFCGDRCKAGWFLLALTPSQAFKDSRSFTGHTLRVSDPWVSDGSC